MAKSQTQFSGADMTKIRSSFEAVKEIERLHGAKNSPNGVGKRFSPGGYEKYQAAMTPAVTKLAAAICGVSETEFGLSPAPSATPAKPKAKLSFAESTRLALDRINKRSSRA